MEQIFYLDYSDMLISSCGVNREEKIKNMGYITSSTLETTRFYVSEIVQIQIFRADLGMHNNGECSSFVG